MGNFDTVLRIVKELAEDCSVEFSGALLRPHSSYLDGNPEKAEEIFQAARQAGYELVKDGRLSRNILRIIGQPLTSQAP